jgi:hypothetical protein
MTQTMFTDSFLAPALPLGRGAASEADCVGVARSRFVLARRCAG